MASDEAALAGRTPEGWSTEAERRYADAQARLAEHCGVDVASRTVDTESAGRIHFLEAGDPDGEPVVFLHGVSTTAATWLPMLSALADDYRLVVPDRPGRGLSNSAKYTNKHLRSFMTAYLADLFDELGLDSPHVVGNSLGGQQAFLLALDHQRVDRLCLVGAPGGVSKEFSALWKLMTVRGVNRVLYWLNSLGDAEENARESTAELLVADDSAVPEPFYDVLAAASGMDAQQWSLRSLQTAQGSFGRMHDLFDLTDELPGIERPTCFVWGTEDSFWKPEVGRPVADSMPDAAFHELDGYGHMPWLDPGDETEERVRAFLDG
ncbi:alpha/beta fold hydrolase [Halobacterium litoreum]|uniref:Alpha/beta fold hydrolase n=1 Tax=Halobacterium litoreum TaxID=2039234 RepID=A0ABD5NDN0_9EURY|nr:alpha/beta hydrolase [Halobacterium litoreum]UHH13828.1 alpha/beta hydrolase [Halobacterium litoreum]